MNFNVTIYAYFRYMAILKHVLLLPTLFFFNNTSAQ